MEISDKPPGHPVTLFVYLFFIASQQAGSFDFGSLVFEFIILIAGLVLSSVYSASEVALFSLVNQMDKLQTKGEHASTDSRISYMLGKPRRLLSTILIGNTFTNIISSVVGAVVAGEIAMHYGLPDAVVYALEVIVLTYMILILSEITPKVIAINNPLRVSRIVSGFIYGTFIVMTPFAKLLANTTMALENRLPKPDNKMTVQDLKAVAEMSEKEGSIKIDEREIIENVIEFGNITVREIMTSRVNIVAVSTNATLAEVISLIQEKGLSRMPLYENDLDNILGVIFSKDLLPFINAKEEFAESDPDWRMVARKALFIPAAKKLDNLLRDFQEEKTHIAIVVDEYGGTEGIVTLDDILEEIVGDISGEYDEGEEKLYTKFKNGVYIFDAKIDLDDLDEILDTNISTPEDEFETLGGLIYHLTERIPNVGERVTYKNIELTVHSVKNNRVKKLRIKLIPEENRAE